MRNAKLKEVLEHAGRVADLAPAANFVRKVPQADIGRSSYRLRFRDRQSATEKAAAPLEIVAASIPAGIRLSIAGARAGLAYRFRLACKIITGNSARHLSHLILTARGHAGEHDLRILETILRHQRI